MDHPLPAPHQRNWRTATIVTAAIAAVELLLLVVLGFALLGKSLLPKVEAAAAQEVAAPAVVQKKAAPVTKAPARAVAQLPRAKVRVLVLNGNGQTGAAASAAQLIQARGYGVQDTGNAERLDYARSVVMYRSGFRGEALRFAKDLNVKIVTPLDGLKRAQLKGAQLALVVGETS